MTWLKRMGFFFLTNLLVMVTVGIVWGLVSTFFFRGLSNYVVVMMGFSFVFGMTGALVSLLLSRWMAKSFYGVQIVDPNTSNPDLAWLVRTVYSLAERAGLPNKPQVGFYESEDVNAFATGPSKSRSLVAVSSGLLRRMTREEAEAVLGHEITHVANGDMVTMALIQGVVNSFAFFFSRLLASVIASNVEERIRPMVRFFATIVGDIAFTMLGSIVVAWFSRRREFRADQGGAHLASRQKMISALHRLQSFYTNPSSSPDLGAGQPALAAMKISHRDGGGLRALFATHPPLEVRIQALENLTAAQL